MAGRNGYLVAAVTAAALAGFWAADRRLMSEKHTRAARNPVRIPTRIGPWRGTPITFTRDQLAPLAHADVLARHYHMQGDAPQRTVELVVVGTRDISAFHNPDSCYRAAGWAVVDKDREPIPLTPAVLPAARTAPQRIAAAGEELTAEKLVVERSGIRLLILYWYAMADGRGGWATDASPTRLGLILSRLRAGGDQPTAFFRVTTLAADGQDAALSRATKFVQALMENGQVGGRPAAN